MNLGADIFVGLLGLGPCCFAGQTSSFIETKSWLSQMAMSKDAIAPEDSRAGLGLLADNGRVVVGRRETFHPILV